MAVKELGYIVLELKDPAGWGAFAENILGFVATDGGGDDLRYRMDAAPFRYLIVKGDADRLAACGWDAGSKQNYDALVSGLKDAGVDVTSGSKAEAARRAVEAFSSFADPAGNPCEVFYGREKGGPFTPGLGVSKFVTGTMGLGHAVLPAPEIEAVRNFYNNVLGFGDSDELTLPPFADGMPDQRIIFLHADNPRHHSLGLYNFPNPVGVVHLMAEVSTIDEVGLCLDRAKAADIPVIASIGRHSYENDHMFSFYMMGPGGVAFEYGCDGKQVTDWSRYEPTKTTSGDVWGHEYNFPGMEA